MGKSITVIKSTLGEDGAFTPDPEKKKFFAQKLLVWCPPDSPYRKQLEAGAEEDLDNRKGEV